MDGRMSDPLSTAMGSLIRLDDFAKTQSTTLLSTDMDLLMEEIGNVRQGLAEGADNRSQCREERERRSARASALLDQFIPDLSA